MDCLYRNVLMPPVRYLTRNDAEVAHLWLEKTLIALQGHPRILKSVFPKVTFSHRCLTQSLMDGLTFANPFGLAAGIDKNARSFPALERMTGAGFIEVGGVPRHRQPGNPRPRIVRVDKDNIINSMGFPSEGIDAVAETIAEQPVPLARLGLQIAPNKSMSPAEAPVDYAAVVRRCKGLPIDYFTINVSSPNTPGLRALQDPKPLGEIVEAVTKELDDQGISRRRLLVKLSPELQHADIEAVVGLVVEYRCGGIILTNTTTTRPVASRYDSRPGGLSGSALYAISAPLVRFAAGLLPKGTVLVATGGIDTVERAYEMLRYADLIGGYTGIVLQGPNLFRKLGAGVVDAMAAEGIESLAELREPNRPDT